MSEYHDSQLTAFGADLAQRASNGDTKFAITKVTSTADDLSQTDFSKLVSLPNEKQTGEIERILPDPNGGTKVKGTKVSFDNLNVSESYPIRAFGLYAKEDVEGAKEQLYALTIAADPETMPKSDSAVMFTFAASIYVVVGNTNQVTINVNPDGFATKEYVADAIANVKVDTSDLAKLSQDNYYTSDNQFKYDPVNKDGDAYGLAKNIDAKVTDNKDGSIIVNGKTFVPADDSKVVHTSDMRKPASDVAGIEEVNAKQDKIAYTPADDSKVWHSNVTQLNSTDMNTVLTAGFYQSINGTNGIPSGDNCTIYQVIPLSSTNGVQFAYETNNIVLGMRSWNYAPGNFSFTDWVTFADDSKVAHLSGANNFDTVPTVNNNPLLLASSLPSDLARTGQDTNFTGKLQKGGIDVATSDDLKSVENSAWHTVTLPDSQGLKNITMIYKIHDDEKYIEANIYAQSVVTNIFECIMLDLSGIVHSITDIDLAFTSIIGNAFLYGNPSGTAEARAVGAKISLPSNCEVYGQSTNISTVSEKGGSFAKIYYDSLVNN
ncbi:MAG: pyocin knob domain-containing protein [Lactobacillus sp.]|nr:pyocin knob domain-containing protein [Lactobacillus sp.]